MKKLLIVTAINDLSIPLFLTQQLQRRIDIDFYFFHEGCDELNKKLLSNSYDAIYIGYHFRFLNKKDFTKQFKIILKNLKTAYIIDNLQTVDDVYFEDKWTQYQTFSEFMPKTRLLTNIKDANNSNYITKERISGRAEGIFFNAKNLDTTDLKKYILQNKIKITKEYRVYVIFDKIITKATIRSSKTEHSKVKVIGDENISPEMIKFINSILTKNKFDFMGMDIAESTKNNFHLIEINRTCLFNGYFMRTGTNLAELLVDGLYKKI
jgi:hypothetical protein